MTVNKKKIKKNLVKKTFPGGRAIIFCGFTQNNTRIELTDLKGRLLKPNSGGMMEEKQGGSKFKGSKETSEIVADLLIKRIEEQVKDYGIKEVIITCKGNGPARKQAVEKLFRNEN